MNKFTEAEKEGREIVYGIISAHCEECYFTPQRYDHVDLFLTGRTGVEAVMEIKYRSGYTSTLIDEMGGHILEKEKFNALLSYDNYKPLYTIVYSNELLMWDVSKITEDRFETVENKYPSNTVMHGDKIPKKVAYLKRDEACTIIQRKDEHNRENSEG